MVFRLIMIAAIACAAIAAGTVSADRITQAFPGFLSLRSGPWIAYPAHGTPDADPYARAFLARAGQIPLGSTEGVAFSARTDSDGEPLKRQCDYSVSGPVPDARLWTFRVFPIESTAPTNFMQSRAHIRDSAKPDADLQVHVGPTLRGANWYRTSQDNATPSRSGNGNGSIGGGGGGNGANEQVFILTLYDSAIVASAGLGELELPTINKETCPDA
ncbi:MAG: DUF1214 domain-containing protein [Pseudomonadota bacterium]